MGGGELCMKPMPRVTAGGVARQKYELPRRCMSKFWSPLPGIVASQLLHVLRNVTQHTINLALK